MTWPWTWAFPRPPARSSSTPTATRGRIRERLLELFRIARRDGRAVGICHPFRETLRTLKENFGLLRKLRARSGPRLRDGRTLRASPRRLEFDLPIRYIRLDRQEDPHEKDRERMPAGGERPRRPLHVCLQVRPVRGAEGVHRGRRTSKPSGSPSITSRGRPGSSSSPSCRSGSRTSAPSPSSTSTSTPSSSSRAIPRTWATTSWPPSASKAVNPGETSEVITLKSNFGVEGKTLASFKDNVQWKPHGGQDLRPVEGLPVRPPRGMGHFPDDRFHRARARRYQERGAGQDPNERHPAHQDLPDPGKRTTQGEARQLTRSR